MRSSFPFLVAATIAFPLFAAEQTPPVDDLHPPGIVESPDYWPGKYVKLSASTGGDPAKLTYVTITKVKGEYQIEGFEGRKFEMTNLNRSLNEVATAAILTKPLARLGLGTATLQSHGVLQIIIDVFVGDDHYYLVRAEPLSK